MPLGYVPGRRAGVLSRVFGSRKYSRAIEYRIIKSWAGARRGVALDLACGSGEYAEQLALWGFRVFGVDIDLDGLRAARQESGLPQRWVAGDAGRLPFAGGRFDLILCNSAVEHFPDDEGAFAEMARVLRPGGALILTTDAFPDDISRWLSRIPAGWRRPELRANADLARHLRQSHQQRHHVARFYTPAGLREKLETAGFLVEHVQPYMNGPVSAGIFELHLVLNALDFYNGLSRRLFPFFYPFTFMPRGSRPGYGLAACARRPR